MARLPIWMRVFVGLMVASVALAIALLNTVDLGFSAVIIVSAVLLMIMGGSFLVAFWMASWMHNTPYSGGTRPLHDRKMMRHEVNQLRGELNQSERYVQVLEETVAQLQQDNIRRTLPPPPASTQTGSYRVQHNNPQGGGGTRATGPHPATRQTGTYPPPRLNSGAAPVTPVNNTDTGRFYPAGQTGAHDQVTEGETVPYHPIQPGHEYYEEEQTRASTYRQPPSLPPQYRPIRHQEDRRTVHPARKGNRRNGRY